MAVQCGGRNQTGTSVFISTDAVSSGVVTATLTSSASNAVITVAGYSGVDLADPTGAVVSVNTNGVSGGCGGGSDSSVYSVPLATTASSSLVVGPIALRNKTHAPGGGFSQQIHVLHGTGGGSAAGMAIFDQEVATPATIDVAGSTSSSVDWAVVAVELKAVSGPPAPDMVVSPLPTLAFGTVSSAVPAGGGDGDGVKQRDRGVDDF